nr:helix-turn-helix domain-containing protein [Chondromyces crocatus]
MKELPLVPAERALKVIGGRWKVFVLYFLFEGPKRLSELRRLIPDVSQKVLVQALREMEEHGIVDREIFAEVPPRVVYTATKLGLSLRPIVSALCTWGRQHADELNAIDERARVSATPPSRCTEVTNSRRTEVANSRRTEVTNSRRTEVANSRRTEVANPPTQRTEVANPQARRASVSTRTSLERSSTGTRRTETPSRRTSARTKPGSDIAAIRGGS